MGQRYLLSHQLPELLEPAGPEVAAVHGGFDGRPYHDEAPHLSVQAGAAEED